LKNFQRRIRDIISGSAKGRAVRKRRIRAAVAYVPYLANKGKRGFFPESTISSVLKLHGSCHRHGIACREEGSGVLQGEGGGVFRRGAGIQQGGTSVRKKGRTPFVGFMRSFRGVTGENETLKLKK